MDYLLTAQAKKKAFDLGVDLVGVGNIERWANAPLLMSPLGLMPTAKAVLVCAIHHTDGMIEIGGEGSPHEQGTYSYQGFMNSHLDFLSYTMARFFEDHGYRAVPITASNIWRYREYKDLNSTFAPDMSHIYASVAAGLTEMGYSGIAMSPEYGPRNRFVSIITDAPLVPDPLLPGNTVCDNCGQCISHCVIDAFRQEVNGEVALEIEGHRYPFANKNLWRCAWSEHFGLDCESEIPAKVTEPVILEKLKELGMRGGTMGCCIKYCLPKDRRSWDKTYSTAPIRKKSVQPTRPAPDRGAQMKLISQCLDFGADRVVVQSLADWKGVDLKPLLPDAKSIVMIAVNPSVKKDSATRDKHSELGGMMAYTMNKCCFYVASDLEKLGYSGTPNNMGGLREDPGKSALESVSSTFKAMLTNPNAVTGFALTSAELTPADVSSCYSPLPPALDVTDTLRKTALELGADVVGIASAERVTKAVNSVKSAFAGERILNAKETGRLWLGSTADISEEERQVHTPEDHLANAKSVVVLGIRIPKQSVENLGRHGAEAIGPYAFAQYESRNLLRLAALRLTKIIQGWGINCVAVDDLANTGSYSSNPRGPQNNMFANRIAAVCAGLGTITKGGFVNHPTYGPNMRYLAIVTDAPLREDQVAELHALRAKCEGCSRCLEACSVKAFKGETAVNVDGHTLKFNLVEQARCDWAIRYGLVAEEGLKWSGNNTNILPPEKITPEALSDALAKRDPILRIRPCTAEMCAMACPYTRSQTV
jgi:epoxyqueuosine reductase QueG